MENIKDGKQEVLEVEEEQQQQINNLDEKKDEKDEPEYWDHIWDGISEDPEDYYDKYDDPFDEKCNSMEKNIYNSKRNFKIIRSKQYNKKEKVFFNHWINSNKYNKEMKQKTWMEIHFSNRHSKEHDHLLRYSSSSPFSSKVYSKRPLKKNKNNKRFQNGSSSSIKTHFENDIEMRRALEESARQFAASIGLSHQQFMDIQSRDLTPQDYEILLLLDEKVQKKTISSNTVKDFSTKIINNTGDICTICLCDYEIGETVKILPKCGHFFHPNCIQTWLTSSSVNCPIDGLPVNN